MNKLNKDVLLGDSFMIEELPSSVNLSETTFGPVAELQWFSCSGISGVRKMSFLYLYFAKNPQVLINLSSQFGRLVRSLVLDTLQLRAEMKIN